MVIGKNSSLDSRIASVVVILMAIGTALVFSAAANLSQSIDLHHFYQFAPIRQILFLPLACIILYAASTFNYKRFSAEKGWLKSPSIYLLILATALLIIVLIPQFGTEINRARRWLRILAGPVTISFQPSELAKWALIIFLPAYCHKYQDSLHLYFKRFLPACLIIGTIVGLVLIEDFGTAAFIALLSFLILLIADTKLWHLLTPLPLAAVGFCAALFCQPSKLQRLAAFVHPHKFTGSAAYQANQSLIALASGGMFGKGLGRGICKYGHLPEDTTDFIFAIIGEELGFVGTAAVIVLFIIFVWLGILIVIRCQDRFGRLLAAGIVLSIAVQAAINIGVVTVVLPTKGIPLPFVSAGGTSMLLSAAAVGVLMNIAKQSNQEEALLAQ
jgi:cell division protein FtsW